MQLLRKPLAWMIAAEVVVVALLVAGAFHFLQGARQQAVASTLPAARVPVRPATPSSAPAPAPSATPTPGKSTAPTPGAGLPFDIATLNSDAASWERLQERLTKALTRALRLYVETVVVPAVERAERVRPAISPATTQSPAAIRNTP